MPSSRPVRSTAGRGRNARTGRSGEPPAPVMVEHRGPDAGYIVTLIALISFGLVMMYSTTAFNGTKDLVRAGIWTGLGIPCLLVASRLSPGFWRKITPWFLVLTLLALFSLLVPGNPLAQRVNGAVRWIKLPGGYQVQPSELAKLAFVLFSAQFLDRRGRRMTGNDWIAYLGVLGVMAGLIYKEPDLGTALVFAGTAFSMLIAAGVSLKVMLRGVLLVALVVAVLAWSTEHQRARLEAWWNPWAPQFVNEQGRQVIMSWSAMARGGWTGVGLGKSLYKLGDRLPEAETDFVFAIVAEELGMLRAILVLVVFGALAWRGYTIAARAPDRYTGLLASGITSWIAVQSCLNVAVATGTAPDTGVPLPFVSLGGSSTVALMVATGIVIRISQDRRISQSEPRAEEA